MEYKVVSLSVGGRGNKIYNSGEIVTDANFIEGRAEELVAKGFLKRIENQEAPKESNLKKDPVKHIKKK